MATASKCTNVFASMRCIHCGEVDSMGVKLETLAVECECGEEITRGEVEAMIAQWSGLYAWLDSAATFAAK